MDEKEEHRFEKNISAQEPKAQKSTWIFKKNEYQSRSECNQETTNEKEKQIISIRAAASGLLIIIKHIILELKGIFPGILISITIFYLRSQYYDSI